MSGTRSLESVPARKVWRLLVVDEYPQTRATTRAVFAHHGYDTHVVGTAAEALDAMRSFQPHAVVLEWYFRNGPVGGLPAKLRAAAATAERRLIVIVLSVFDEPEDYCDRDEIDEYFVKPTGSAVVDQAIRARLE